MEINNLSNQVSIQAATQASANASLLLLRKTLELQAAGIGGLIEAAAPTSASSNPPNLGNNVDLMPYEPRKRCGCLSKPPASTRRYITASSSVNR